MTLRNKKHKNFNLIVLTPLNILAVALIRKLTNEGSLKTFLVSDSAGNFKKFIKINKFKKKVYVISSSELLGKDLCNYFFYIENNNDFEEFKDQIAWLDKQNTKCIFVFPISLSKLEYKKIEEKIKFINKFNFPYQIFFVSTKLFNKYPSLKILNPNTIKQFSESETIDNSAAKKIARFLLKSLLTFGFLHKKVFLEVIVGGFNHNKQGKLKRLTNISYPYVDEKISLEIKSSLAGLIKKSKTKNIISEGIKTSKNNIIFLKNYIVKPRKIFTNRKEKLLFIASSFLFVIIIIPFILFVFSFLNLIFAGSLYSKDNLNMSNKSYRISEYSSRILNGYFEIISNAPALDKFLSMPRKINFFLINTSKLGLQRNKIHILSENLLEEIFGDSVLNSLENLSLELDNYQANFNFWQEDLKSLNDYIGMEVLKIYKINNLSDSQSKISFLTKLAKEFKDAMNLNSLKTFALVFQNEKIERPTGGMIYSVMLVSFSEGKIRDIKYWDVKDLDSRLKGNVLPPEPIKKYYKKNFYLEDSNWDPNFSDSAKQIIWFLEKETGYQIDGVVALNSNLVDKILEGKLNKNKLVNNNLIWESKDFQESWEEEGNNTFRQIFQGLLSKDIQVYIKYPSLQETINNLGWSGTIYQIICNENCLNDVVALINADLTLPSEAKPLEKKVQLKITIEESVIKREMSVYFKNNSDKRYNGYFRVLAPLNVGFSPFTVADLTSNNLQILTIKNRLSEGGLYITFEPYEEIRGSISWESGFELDFNKKGSYEMSWFKQSGSANLPVSLVIKFPQTTKILTATNLTLTKGNMFEYNSNLTKDSYFKISW